MANQNPPAPAPAAAEPKEPTRSELLAEARKLLPAIDLPNADAAARAVVLLIRAADAK